MNDRKELAGLIQVWADNPESYFNFQNNETCNIPTIYSDLNEWELIIPPKENPMEKYIELGLDCEFANTHDDIWFIYKLSKICDEGYYAKSHDKYGDRCRLRPNHIHWWDGESDINPIPDNCDFRVYLNDSGWTEIAHSVNSRNVIWHHKDVVGRVLAFEIKYLE